MLNLLLKVTGSMAAFLGGVLPTLSNYSWNQNVLQGLLDRQRQRIEQQGINTLAKLDLAMLLRVLDKNWYQISSTLGLSSEERNFVKEMPTIRNRWAHATTQGFSPNDEYRDLDTLLRFAQVIGAEDTLLQEVRTAMLALLPKIEASLIQDGAIAPVIPTTRPVGTLPEKNEALNNGDVTPPPEECKNNGDKITTTRSELTLTWLPAKTKTKKRAPKNGTPKKCKPKPPPAQTLKF